MMKKILYVDAYSGISGDMLMGAFLDAGLPLDVVEKAFQELKLDEEFKIRSQSVMKGVIRATQFRIELTKPDESDHHHHTHHRHMADIRKIIQNSSLKMSVKANALKIFELLAKAEGKVHGVNPDEVHFHEVGATDSILDIVGICIGLDYFQIEEVFCSGLPWCEGTVHTQHGQMPIPAPATMLMLNESQAVIRRFTADVELITPTGAAFLAAFARYEKPEMKLEKLGCGAGSKDLSWPNIMRVMIGGQNKGSNEEHIMIETHIDDMNPEWFGHLMERSFASGALDVTFTPIYMKKNRPATLVTIVATRDHEAELANLLLQESTTFGVRVIPVKRYESERDFIKVITEWGDVRVKRKWMDGKVIQWSPEFEDCRRIANEYKLPLPEVVRQVFNRISEIKVD
jgi:uncharacterized protein (TIGR00299 family) protein